MNQAPDAQAAAASSLRPLTGLVGRGSELGRLIGHLDARRSVRLQAARGAGTTALLRALCAEPPRPGAPDGTVALPVGLPVDDLAAVTEMLLPGHGTPLTQRQLLVLLDDRDASADDLTVLQRDFGRSLLVVTGQPDSAEGNLTPVAIHGLSQHHAVGLVEAAMGRALTIEQGRSARLVATAVDGLPGPLVQAAAAVRDGGLTFDHVLDVLDAPVRPSALAVWLQSALDDDLHATLSHVRALGDVPATTAVAAAACGLDIAETTRRLRRLAVIGLVLTDGRGGWTVASGIPAVSEPVRAASAARVAEWVASGAALSVFDLASVLSVVADRVSADDHATTLTLTQATLASGNLDGLDATRALLERATTWAMPEPGETLVGSASVVADAGAVRDAGVEAPADVRSPDDTAITVDSPVAADGGTEPGDIRDDDWGSEPSTEDSGDEQNPVMALLSDRRRLALIAVVAAAVIAAMLLVVPSLRDDSDGEVLRGEIDLGVATITETTSGTLTLDLTGTTAALPVALVLDGPDADAFTVDPDRCDTRDCRASLTFTADRAGVHVATVRAVDNAEVERAVVELTGSGTGDPPPVEVATNLAVTLFPAEPAQIPAGGSAVLPVGVRNNGPDDSTGARLVVTVPPRVTAEAPGCTFDEAVLTCPLAELPAGSQQRVEVSVSLPPRIQQVRVTAEVTPVTDTDDAGGDNAAGFTYPVAPPAASDGQTQQ